MAIQFPIFIGRDQELSDIDRQVARRGHSVTINITGSGGIGKTAILRKVQEHYRASPTMLVTDIIDFSHTVHRSEMWILEQMAAVYPKGFPNYRKWIRKIHTAPDTLTRIGHERELLAAFINDYNVLAHDYRFILLFDTLELIQDTPLFNFILEAIKPLKNTALFLAGRRNDEEFCLKELSRVFPSTQIKNIQLKGFDEKEAEKYFEETQTPRLKDIHPDLQKNIYFLSEGKPIKIALSLDWLDRGIPIMPEVIQVKPDDLRNKSTEEIAGLRRRFEFALMEGIRQFQTPVDEIVLYMAHFNKRFNRKLLETFFLNNLDKRQKTRRSKKLVDEIKALPFVKYTSDEYFVLHDEMARLVQTYVWDVVEDPDRTLRKELSERICAYYEDELKALPAWKDCTEQQRVETRSYEVESLYYKLYTDFRSGFSYFGYLYEKLTRDRRSGLAALALSFAREFGTDNSSSQVLKCFMDGYYTGGILISQERFEESIEKLVEGEKGLEKAISDEDWQKAAPLDLYLRERMHMIYQQLGFCYRSMGDWAHAEENYQLSLKMVLKQAENTFCLSGAFDRKTALARQIAETLNNLAYLYRLMGNFYEAHLLCQTSVMMRKTWGLDSVMSQYVMAMTLWEMGDTAESVNYLISAERECVDDYKFALLKKYHAYILFRTGLADQALPMLDEAEAIFRQKGQRSELADAINIRCRIYRVDTELIADKASRRGYMKYVEELGKDAYRLAKENKDKFRIAECHLTQAYHYYHWSKIDPQHALRYQQAALKQWHSGVELAQGAYHQIYSRYCQLRGDIAFDSPEPDYDLAFAQYIEQCKIATHFKQATYERAIDHLGERLRSLGGEDPDTALRHIRNIIETWNNDPALADDYTDLVEELNEVRLAIQESEKLKELKSNYDRAMLEGRLADAASYSDEILNIPGLYTDDRRAEILLVKSQVAHRQERLSESRRYAKVALQIGRDLKKNHLIGNANLMLTSILWDTTSTAEAAEHLKAAQRAFEQINDQIGLASAQRFQNYIYYRTRIYENLLENLGNAVRVLERHKMDADVADLKNIMSRVARTDPLDGDYGMARQYAEEALTKAESSGDVYRRAECLLSLAVLSLDEKKFEDALVYYEKGIAILPEEMHTIRTVYEGIRGSAYYEIGYLTNGQEQLTYWDQAFDAFIAELKEASQSKPASLVRSLELLFDFIIRLPSKEFVTKYTDQIERHMKEYGNINRQLARSLPHIYRMLEQTRQYYPYIRADTGRKDS